MVSFRFRRALLGYNRADVDQAIGSSAAELRNADRRADKAESALSEVRGELDHSRSGLLESRREADARAGRVRELEAVVSWLADRVVDRERELRTVRDELSRDRWGDPERGLAKRTPATG
ncbi:MAG: hypothetical protein H0W09_01405, partial [Solirubrobacterales bacterium]|nr:hypothetical protein [Solirubrobacterales bacterium]